MSEARGRRVEQARLLVAMLEGEILELPAEMREEVLRVALRVLLSSQGPAGRRALALVAAQAELAELEA
jgi:hypothetical protein